MGLFSFFQSKTLPPLFLRNTLSGAREKFVPLNNTVVRMYNCGPTAYDNQHIGNLFPPVVANVLRRTLETWGYSVQEVNNITDFGHISDDEDSEDKMTRGLRREGLPATLENMRALAERYVALFFDDLPKLGVDPKRVIYPRASDYIQEQILLIQTLEQKGYAYRTGDGVYFDAAKFPNYGKLGGLKLVGEQRARVEENKEKRNFFDFALWKLDSKLGWKSPWGLGFPGWHTECVAMIFKLLGQQIDIHMGGIDLAAIHHNNEIAQAQSATDKLFVKYWLHNAHITVDGKKISKSLGNTVYLSDLINHGLNPLALRYWFLTGHYRTPMNFTWAAIEGADTALKRLTKLYHELPSKSDLLGKVFLKEFYIALANDLDTPKALALIWKNIKNLNQATLAEADKILGLGLAKVRPSRDVSVDVKKLMDEREAARAAKDFARSDALRKQIEKYGFKVKDTFDGSQISPK